MATTRERERERENARARKRESVERQECKRDI